MACGSTREGDSITPVRTSRTVAALFHERESRARQYGYKIWKMGEIWARRGIRLVPVFGIDDAVDADAWINHLDLTLVPERYAAFLETKPRVVNRQVLDISKRTISRNLVSPSDGYDGPVIVKSNLNHGGVPERRAFREAPHEDDPRPPPSFRLRGPAILRTVARKGRVSPGEYPIYDAAGDVPLEIFESESLVVERFLPERDGEHYCTRSYVFFNDFSWCVHKWATGPVIRHPIVVWPERIEPHPEMVTLRKTMGFDYGKFDYVEIDGHPILLDAARTPTFALADAPLLPHDIAMLEALQGGIDAFLN